MKKQIIAGMLLLVLLILPVSLYLQIDRAFRQNLESARASALREESAIAQGLSLEMRRNGPHIFPRRTGSCISFIRWIRRSG